MSVRFEYLLFYNFKRVTNSEQYFFIVCKIITHNGQF